MGFFFDLVNVYIQTGQYFHPIIGCSWSLLLGRNQRSTFGVSLVKIGIEIIETCRFHEFLLETTDGLIASNMHAQVFGVSTVFVKNTVLIDWWRDIS